MIAVRMPPAITGIKTLEYETCHTLTVVRNLF